MEKVILITVVPDIIHYHSRIKAVKDLVQQVLDNALIDFMMVSSVFKKYSQFSDPSMSGEDANRVSQSIKELQYMDIFSQKLDHILRLNQEINKASSQAMQSLNYDHAGFIFKLNYLQTIMAADEFLFNANYLKKNLHELHDHILSVTKLDFNDKAYFKHLGEIEGNLDQIKRILDEMYAERCQEAPVLVADIEEEVKKLGDLYTMASERFVLLWALKNMGATAELLLEQYKREGYESIEEEIDLF